MLNTPPHDQRRRKTKLEPIDGVKEINGNSNHSKNEKSSEISLAFGLNLKTVQK